MKNWMFLLVILLPQLANTQALPRRAFLGIQMENVNDDVRRATGFKGDKGVLISRVIPGSTAGAAGLQKGDILTQLGGESISNPNDAVEMVHRFSEGAEMPYQVYRKGKLISKSVRVKGAPRENFDGIETVYSEVRSDNNLLRTILSLPQKRPDKVPGILFIQGVGCYSMDTPTDTLRSEYQLINYLVRNGFAVMRVDKPGLGDSKGVSCSELDFNTELNCYKAAFESLQNNPGIDAGNLFIIGHSMGGVMAPLIARDHPVKGIVAYGTIGVNFMEYFTGSRRTIAQAYQMTAAEADEYVKFQCECAGMIIGAKMSKAEVQAKNTECAGMYDDYLYRGKDFWYQLYDLNIPQAWEKYPGKVLAAWGEADYISTRQDHEYIASVVNAAHKGNGSFVMVPQSSHNMTSAGNFAEALQKSRDKSAIYNPSAAKIFLEWLGEQLNAKVDFSPTASNEKLQQVLWNDGVENAYPRWSKDGKDILFQSNKSGKWQLYLIHADGTNIRQLTNDHSNNNFPDWSADNSTIAFVSDRDGNEEIYVMNTDGTNARRLTNNTARDIHPYFSPDGKTLLFNSSRDNAQSFDVYRINTDGTGLLRLTATKETETCARFSPDGSKIVFLKDDGNDEIYCMNADGTQPVNLTHTPQTEGWPCWSADGKKIVFSSQRNGVYALYSMNADGSDVQQLTFPQAPEYDARAGVAYTNDRIVFNRQNKKGIGIFILEIDDKL